MELILSLDPWPCSWLGNSFIQLSYLFLKGEFCIGTMSITVARFFISFMEKLLYRIVRDNKVWSVLRDISFMLFYHQPSSSSSHLTFSSHPLSQALLYVTYICDAINENCLCCISLRHSMYRAKIKIPLNKCFLSVFCVFLIHDQLLFLQIIKENCICLLLSIHSLKDFRVDRKRLSGISLCCLLVLGYLLTRVKYASLCKAKGHV